MNRFLLTAAALVFAPLAAQATSLHPDTFDKTVTGKVQITPIMCITTPCYPIVELVTDAGERYAIKGSMLRDVESLAGQGYITVTGSTLSGGLDVEALAPGKSKSFVTGTVKDVSVCNTAMPADCQYAVELHALDGKIISITDEKVAKGLSKMDGALVSVKGTVTNTPCPPGTVCIQLYKPTLWPLAGANIWVRGALSDAMSAVFWAPGVEIPRYFAGFPNGNQANVYTSKNWSSRYGADAWLSGAFDAEGKFRATKAGLGIYVDVPFTPWDASTAVGSNVSRDASTEGGAVASTQQAGGAAGAGMKRD